MPADWTRRQRWKNDLIYAVVRGALACARVLPRRACLTLGRAVGALARVAFPSARRLAERNLRRAFPEGDLAPVVRRVYRSLGELLGDAVCLLRPQEPARLTFLPGAREVLERALSAGRGVVLVTAHLGPWERLAAALVERGFPLTTPVRASYDPRFEALVFARLREARGVVALDRDAPGTARALLRALGRGEVVGFLIDLDTRVASVEVSFFDAPARTPSAPARLASRTGAPVVAAFATRAGISVVEVRSAGAPCRVDGGAVRDLTQAMTAQVEAAVRNEPDRWIWMHDRWGDRRRVNEKGPP